MDVLKAIAIVATPGNTRMSSLAIECGIALCVSATVTCPVFAHAAGMALASSCFPVQFCPRSVAPS